MKERENRPDRSNLLVSLQQIHEIESNQLFSHALMEPLMNIRTLFYFIYLILNNMFI
jgi:hypothetical protein